MPRGARWALAVGAALSARRTMLFVGRASAAAAAADPDGPLLPTEHYRADGVRMTHDPYEAGMAEKYGRPGKTDREGFDPYSDTVGAGIYGGIVKRDGHGQVIIGKQYQNHNPHPGPVYAGGGYTPMIIALRKGKESIKPLLDKYPDLVNGITTGGARPLHMCGMGKTIQLATEYLILRGADVEALDTYGMTPLHRMASNNLEVGARALLEGGADPQNKGRCFSTPAEMAEEAKAYDVLRLLEEFSRGEAAAARRRQQHKLKVHGSGVQDVNGVYLAHNPQTIPVGFSLTCAEMHWDPEQMWLKLSDQTTPWFQAENGSYIYWNKGDGKWWIDAPDGKGVYIVRAPAAAMVPREGWLALPGWDGPLPEVEMIVREGEEL